MFSSTNNDVIINPFSHLLSSSSYLPVDLDFNDVFLQQHYDHLLSASSVLPSNPQLTESLFNMTLLNNSAAAAAATVIKQDGGRGCGGIQGGEWFHVPVKKPVKKDRHSKIRTAQGMRDRRVRLSMNIARQFFDLQDLLGFDKASKTLEWLMEKSRNPIKEVMNMKNGEADIGTKDKKMKAKDHQQRESRAKARERARERTREKMYINIATTSCLTQNEAINESNGHSYGSAGRENGIRESVVMKAKLKPCLGLGFDQLSQFV